MRARRRAAALDEGGGGRVWGRWRLRTRRRGAVDGGDLPGWEEEQGGRLEVGDEACQVQVLPPALVGEGEREKRARWRD